MKMTRFFVTLLCMAVVSTKAIAADYTTYLTPERGFTEVTTTGGIINDANYYYLLTPAEVNTLIVGVGAYEAKPDWASEETKALRYKSVDTDPVLNLSNFFTIEKSGQYIGFRNVVYCADMFQTHLDAGFMYVNTYTDDNFDEWSYLTPTYQNGYWIFESGKYPLSSGHWSSGYLGPWNNRVEANEALALNRKNVADDEAGHYRLFRIDKNDLRALQIKALQSASNTNPLNATWLITNPTFETGDETGWTLVDKDPNGNDEFKTRDYGMSGKDGNFLMNAYQWWAPNLSVTQTVNNVPSGVYELSGVVATWEGRDVFFSANETTVTNTGIKDATGIPVTIPMTIGVDGKLVISAGSTGQWWVGGHESETQTFFKLDDVRLTCKGVYMNGLALPLPNDDITLLDPGQWYYYDVDYSMEYWLFGNIDDMVYSTDGDKFIANVTTTATSRQMILPKGRVYFKTTRSDATLRIAPYREVEELSEFTACALNVDGLPQSINLLVYNINLNGDGPGSDGTKAISSYLAGRNLDIIGVSEDFNYDGSLRSQIGSYNHGTWRGSIAINLNEGAWNGTKFDTDGLNIYVKNKYPLSGEDCIEWDTSKGSIWDGDDGQYDEIINKGFRHYQVQLKDGVLVDVYVLHMDAGSRNGDSGTPRDGLDTEARNAQWTQLANYILTNNDNGCPKIVIGDTNSRYTRDKVKTNFIDVIDASGNYEAKDAWVELVRGGEYPTYGSTDLTTGSRNSATCEIVDKIIYINPTNGIKIQAQAFDVDETNYKYPDDYAADESKRGKPLGDHSPVVVTFKAYQFLDPIDYYHDVTIGNAKYATLSLPWNATIPEGVSAYTSDYFNPSTHKIELQSVNGILPARTGVILYSDTPDMTYRFHLNGNETEDIEGNILYPTHQGRLTQDKRDEEHYAYYVLANRDNHVAMYRLGIATIPQYRAYLMLPKEAVSTMAGVIERVVFGFDQDDIVSEDGGFLDAINSAEDTKSNIIGIYAPSGTRRQEMRKGVNIIQMSNGTTKKVIR